MFVSGRAQRVGNKRSGTSIRNVVSTTAGIPNVQQFAQGAGKQSSKRTKVATIGGNDTVGLVIRGRYELEESLGENPDSATPPLAGDSLANPDYNISYAGLGTLKFASPVRIPVVQNDVAIQGNLNVSGGIDTSEYLLDGVPIVDSLVVPIVTDFSGDVELSGGAFNFTKDPATTIAQAWTYLGLTHIRVHYFWTSKGAASGGVRLQGIPFDVQEPAAVLGQAMTTDHTTAVIGSVLMSAGDPSNVDQLRIMDFNQSLKAFLHVQSGTFENSGSIVINVTYQHAII